MTILSVVQSASVRLVGRRPGSAVGNTSDRVAMELVDLANEAATAMVRAHDWRVLTKLHSVTGDGTTTEFAFPSDYDRMPVYTQVHSADFNTWRYTPARGLDQWLDVINGLTIPTPGLWIFLDGELQIRPAPAVGETPMFYYISNQFVTGKSEFTLDADTFLLDEETLKLALIWKWRQQKRLEYSEDLANYEISLSQRIARDKGSRLLTTPLKSGMMGDISVAYPRALGS